MNLIKNIKNIFMPRAKSNKTKSTENVGVESVESKGPKGFNETTGQKLTIESFTAYIENMKENEPEKYAENKDGLERKLSELSE